jgi:uncharacterized membrane protein YdjX (TVP38/TMEM64 family)
MGATPSNRGSLMNKYVTRLIILFLLIAAITFSFIYFDLHTFFIDRQKVIQFVNSFGPLSVIIFIALQILQVLIAPIPGEVTGFIGGYIYGIALGTVYSTIGLSIGSWIAFVLSRTFGLPLVEKFVSRKIIDQYDHFMEHKGTFVSFLLFLIPGFPKDALCYILGLSHMNVRSFIVISTIGRLLGTLLLTVQGNCVRNDQNWAFFIMVGISGLIFLVGYFFGQNWLNKLKERHEKKVRSQSASSCSSEERYESK